MTAWKSVGTYLCVAGMASAIVGCNWGKGSKGSPFTASESDLRNPVKTNVAYAKLQEDRGLHADARRHYELAIKGDSKSVDAILGIARLDRIAGRNARAEQGFKKAIRLEPGNAHAIDALGMHYLAVKRFEEAVTTFKQASEAKPDVDTYRYHLGIALTNSGEIREAMSHFSATIGEAAGHYNIGHILQDRGQLQAAEKHYHLALSIQPDLIQARQMLAELKKNHSSEKMLAGPNNRRPDLRASRRSPIRSTSHEFRNERSESPFTRQHAPISRDSQRPEIRRDDFSSHMKTTQHSPQRPLGEFGANNPADWPVSNSQSGRGTRQFSESTSVNPVSMERTIHPSQTANPFKRINYTGSDQGNSQEGTLNSMTPEQREQWANQR